jgi:hypothetical protein
MAHYARIGYNNIVEQVIVIPNEVEPTEADGIAYCQQLLGQGEWRKTSYNASIRKNYAGIGYTYDVFRDAFIPPKPFDSWIFNEQTCCWDPPTPMPDDGFFYHWDNLSQSWIKV